MPDWAAMIYKKRREDNVKLKYPRPERKLNEKHTQKCEKNWTYFEAKIVSLDLSDENHHKQNTVTGNNVYNINKTELYLQCWKGRNDPH